MIRLSRRAVLRNILLAAALGLPALAQSTASSNVTVPSGHGDVMVLYAGSLTNMMEHDLGPAFQKATGFTFVGEGKGSKVLGSEIKGKLRRGDVFISASPDVDEALMGRESGDWVRWYTSFAEAPVVIGYYPKSRIASQLTDASWPKILSQPGLRLGRTDPKLDPKGSRAVELVENAAKYYGMPDLVQQMLGSAENTKQIFPEQTLVGRLQSGQLDAGFFYSNEAAEEGIPFVTPPAAIDPKAEYTVTVLSGAPNEAGAEAFVAYLFSADGQALLKRHGLTLLKPSIVGDAGGVPASLEGVFSQP